jgi:putative nucleotidyltransferase with HDIG domain
MRRIAWFYIFGIMTVAGLLSVASFLAPPAESPPDLLFLVLTLTTALLLMSVVISPNRQAYEGSTIGLMAGVLLLPPWLFVLQVVVAHAIEWLWFRLRAPHDPHLRAWYIQPFNVAKVIVSGVAAQVVARFAPLPDQGYFAVDSLLAVLLAIVVYVAVNQVILGLVLWLGRGISFRQAGIFRDAALIEAPLACLGYVAVALLKQSPLAVLFVLAPVALVYQACMLPKLQHEAMQALEKVNRELIEANQSIRQLNDELFRTLAKIFDSRDPFVGGHAAQVATYAVAIARQLQLPAERVEVIRQAAYLHDIGKIAIPESILHKPGPLTVAEFELLKRHTDIGADFISTTRSLRHLAPFIRHHHERWDGAGYPLGLAGEDIPLEARILNVCDSVEAMASDRSYHRALAAPDIVDELERCAGSQFDPAVVEGFCRAAEQEGAGFVVNSARVAAVRQGGLADDLSAELFRQVYGILTA